MRENHNKIVCIKLVHLPYLCYSYFSLTMLQPMLPLYSAERSSGFAFAKIHWTEKKEAVDCRWILHAPQLQGLRKPLKKSVSCPGREPKESLTKYIKSLG